jgi:hypothetical protein
MRFRLRTLLIALALGPPVLALAWWYGRVAIGELLLVLLTLPALIFFILGYTFDVLCHLIGVKPSDDRAENSK